MNDFAVGKSGGELKERASDLSDAIQDGGVGGDGDVVLGEIDAGLEQGDQVDQFLLDGLEAIGERAFELLGGDLGLKQGLRVDQVADGFGLGKVEASVEKGSHGEFTGLGETGAAGKREFDDVAEDDGRPVSGDFDDVVGGVGVGLSEVGDYDFVDAGVGS